MMMNRDKLGFWVRLTAILLAVVFLGSFIFMGIGTNVNYNLFELLGGSEEQQGGPTVGQEEQIRQAEENLKEHPEDPEAIKGLATLYLNNGRLEDAARVLEEGRKKAPKDEEIPIFLGQIYFQQAQAMPEGEQQKDLYDKAGDAFAAATQIEPENEDAYLLAGEAYDRAGQPGQAIKYWNGYLEIEPEGEQANAVKERISTLLEGGGDTTAAGGDAQP